MESKPCNGRLVYVIENIVNVMTVNISYSSLQTKDAKTGTIPATQAQRLGRLQTRERPFEAPVVHAQQRAQVRGLQEQNG